MRHLLLALAVAGCASVSREDRTADVLRSGRAIEKRDEEIEHLCKNAQRRHVDALFIVLEREDAKHALSAIGALSPLLTAEDLPRIEAMLTSKDPNRVLVLLRMVRFGPANALLVKHAKSLLAGTAKVALGAIGELRLRGASEAVFEYILGDNADEDAGFKALGRIWEQKLDAPALSREDEHARLKALALAHGMAMRVPTAESCEALLRIMTRAELDDFLAKHARDKFAARGPIAEVCSRKGFDAKKGALVHRAMLSSADADLVALILWSSPYTLKVWDALADERPAKLRGVPEARVCDFAAARLEAEEKRKPMDVAADAATRDALVTKWRQRKTNDE